MLRVIGRRGSLFGIAAAFVPLFSFPSGASELTGRVIPPLPYGIFGDGSVCIGRTSSSLCERSLVLLKTSAGRDFLIYTGSAEPSQGKKARWRITDTLAFPNIRRNHLEFVWNECRRSGTLDGSIAAIVQSDPKREWLRARDWAYRVDYDTGKFVKVEAKDVECANPALEDEN